jgi:antitoxin component YwqK of YwqJK toxin-antitoxin module
MTKHRYSIIFLFFYCLVGCKMETEKTYYSNGSIRDETETIDGKRNGVYKAYFPNGTLAAAINFIDDKKDGVAYYYYENGTLKLMMWYENDISNGVCKTYYPNGQIRSVGCLYNGIKAGWTTYYYPNGKISELSNFKNNKYNGESWTTYSDGSIASYSIFKDSVKEYNKKYDSVPNTLKSIFRNISIECRDTLIEGEKFDARIRLFGPLDSNKRVFKTGIAFYGEEEYAKEHINILLQEVPLKQKDSILYISPLLLPGKHSITVQFYTIENSIVAMYQGDFHFLVLPTDSKKSYSFRTYNKYCEVHSDILPRNVFKIN